MWVVLAFWLSQEFVFLRFGKAESSLSLPGSLFCFFNSVISAHAPFLDCGHFRPGRLPDPSRGVETIALARQCVNIMYVKNIRVNLKAPHSTLTNTQSCRMTAVYVLTSRKFPNLSILRNGEFRTECRFNVNEWDIINSKWIKKQH